MKKPLVITQHMSRAKHMSRANSFTWIVVLNDVTCASFKVIFFFCFCILAAVSFKPVYFCDCTLVVAVVQLIDKQWAGAQMRAY